MNWPLASDYQDAVQNPAQCFADAQLKAGQPVLTRLGLPRVASGTFASVYELKNGAQRWAVRCFLRPGADQQNRYALLSQHLGRLRMPGLVGFAYEAQGIRVKGQWYPIVKMDWVEGQTLHTYVGQHVSDGGALRRLAAQWRDLMRDLRAGGIAHADLQHGNVLVTPGGDLRLVDYDGMWVPAFQGQSSHELGHPNYQHPQRGSADYNAHLDDFSALVIYTSLVALVYDPGLWAQFHTGENLIFSASDFKAPQKSPLFERLYHSGESLVRDLSQRLALACEGPLARIPDFAHIAAAFPDIPAARPWWKEEETVLDGGAHAKPGGRGTPHVVTSAHATIQDASSPHTSARPDDTHPGWWKGDPPKPHAAAPAPPSGTLVKGFLLPFLRLWQGRDGSPLPAVSASIPSAPARTSPAPPTAAPRAVEKKRPRNRWLTCSSVTCLLLCLTAYGVILLAQVVAREAQSVWADVNDAHAPVPAKAPPKLSPAPAAAPQLSPGVHSSRSKN